MIRDVQITTCRYLNLPSKVCFCCEEFCSVVCCGGGDAVGLFVGTVLPVELLLLLIAVGVDVLVVLSVDGGLAVLAHRMMAVCLWYANK